MKRQCNGDTGGRRSHRQFRGIRLILASLLLGAGVTYGSGGWEDWTGFGGLNTNWSNDGNWNNATGSPVAPVAGDNVRFGSWSTNSASVLDQDFSIAWLQYLGGGTHVLDIPTGNTLRVTDLPIEIGKAGTGNGATVTWTGGGTIEAGTSPAGGQAINVGYNGPTKPGESNTSSLTITGVTVNTYANSGKVTGVSVGANYAGGGAAVDATLTLGAGAHLNIGTPTSPIQPGLTIGYNNGVAGTATGQVDISGGTANIHVAELGIGNNNNGNAGGGGSAAGTLTMGANNTVTSDSAYVAWGDNTAGTVNMNGGLFAANTVELGSGGTFNFNGGRLAVNTFTTYGQAGTLVQQGGTLAPGFNASNRALTSLAGTSLIEGNYEFGAAGTLEIELFGTTAGTEYDQLKVLGQVDLGLGTLDVDLNFEPLVGDQFTIIDSGLGVLGQFSGLSDQSMLDTPYLDSMYRFQISYSSFGAGNDVMLQMIGKIDSVNPVVIPAPGAMMLGSIGVGLLSWLRRRRTL